ncbi:hypothetical protein ACIUVT_000899 [Yersinia enterocolitica]
MAYKLAAWEGAERQSFFNVVCKISHQLSCANFGCHYQHWSARSLHINEVARQLNTRARQALVLNELLRVLMGSEGNTFAGGPPC